MGLRSGIEREETAEWVERALAAGKVVGYDRFADDPLTVDTGKCGAVLLLGTG